MPYKRKNIAIIALGCISILLSSCGFGSGRELPPAPTITNQAGIAEEYLIGPLDELTIFVWRNPELGAKVRVRPDGRITTPLISDLPAAGKTSAMLAQDIKIQLSEFINEPIVQVIVSDFGTVGAQQVRVIGATEKPAAIPFTANMTLLDAMIAVGGLSEFASGNKATLIRVNRGTGRKQEFALRINDLLRRGSSQANIPLQPGDVIIIPTSSF